MSYLPRLNLWIQDVLGALGWVSDELSVKKLLGAESRYLILQFVGESVVLVGLAFVLGILLAQVIIELGVMEDFTGKAELGQLLLSPERIPVLLLAWLSMGVLAGIYPALQLSKPSMMALMSPLRHIPGRTIPLRELLVWLQMTVAMAIIASVFIMLRQSEFLLQSPLGFEKANRFVVQLQGVDAIRNRAAIMQALKQHEDIVNVTETSGAIGRSLSISILEVETETGGSQNLTMNSFNGGENYLDTLGIVLVAGDSARMNTAALNTGGVVPILVNESFVKGAGWSQAIGKRVGSFEVVGVVRDFHYMPLQQAIGMLYISSFNDRFLDTLPPSRENTVAIDLIIATTGRDEGNVRTYIREVIDEFSEREFSGQPQADVLSLETIWNDNYDDETRIIGLVGIFAGLSIVISLLGLGGMGAYNNARRGREVAIRKVLGASVANILALLGSSMVKVLMLAALPAFLGAWFLSNLWLQRFVYRIDPDLTPFVLALLIVSICSALVMIAQTWRVANENPVQKIKYE